MAVHQVVSLGESPNGLVRYYRVKCDPFDGPQVPAGADGIPKILEPLKPFVGTPAEWLASEPEPVCIRVFCTIDGPGVWGVRAEFGHFAPEPTIKGNTMSKSLLQVGHCS